MTVVLKADNGSKLAPSMYQVWDMEGGNRGSDDVRDSIAGCNTQILGFDDTFVRVSEELNEDAEQKFAIRVQRPGVGHCRIFRAGESPDVTGRPLPTRPALAFAIDASATFSRL